MLSKRDIYKELGKEINIVPLKESNIKENSINVTISEYAWTLGEASVCWCGGAEFHLDSSAIPETQKKFHRTFHKGQNAIFWVKKDKKIVGKYLILLPHTTTVVETEEVIGLGEKIGGAVHSKVGVVAKGVGDTGTMLGPGYCGHLLLSLHNITDDVIALPVGSTVVSLTFEYLNTPVQRTSLTSSSHYDKLLELGVSLSENDKTFFSADWKGNLQLMREKLKASKEYADCKKHQNAVAREALVKWFSVKRIVTLLVIALALLVLGIAARYFDRLTATNEWTERYWMILIASVVGYVVPITLKKLFE